MSKEVIHLKLINSEEIIGELANASNDEIFIQNPMLVSEVTDEKSKMSTIVLSKYVLFDTEAPIAFKQKHVITNTGVLTEIKNYYYNSIKYNSKFVDPVVKKELQKINEVMENILDQAMMEIPMAALEVQSDSTLLNPDGSYVQQQDQRFYINGSNTVH